MASISIPIEQNNQIINNPYGQNTNEQSAVNNNKNEGNKVDNRPNPFRNEDEREQKRTKIAQI